MPSTTPAAAQRLAGPERRAAILTAATELALSEGLAALTLRRVGERAGVASGLVAHYVDGMDALVAEVFARISGEERAEVARVEGVAAVVRTLTDGSRDAVTLVWVQAWAAAPGNAELARAVRAEMDAWQGLLEERLREAGAPDPAPVARVLLGMIDGVNAHGLADWRDRADHAPLLMRALESMLGLPLDSP
ncbi:TetR family transcriptional regulator C-terminal domain-containing protein [Demequina sp. SYSU T00192]|uniref:TetR family transcriptional regulator C-terminal domain-containing protein n=1 Tax=Demequina litoralis TaxID=3051660 RepID=A0ABT8G5I8_9MICO|nr:TetR family transcriptional regulator C-terminal domain-containing protein [Demequina sp. SYSU T00192]MDN4474393.1 TetR family transcriptional regulator C-terminal domain-containing protein [Demequina sp. SYSU T00192]